jgi:hypothetical protein
MRFDGRALPFRFDFPGEGELQRDSLLQSHGINSLIFNAKTGFIRVDFLWGPLEAWRNAPNFKIGPGENDISPADTLVAKEDLQTPSGSTTVLVTKRGMLSAGSALIMIVVVLLAGIVMTQLLRPLLTHTGARVAIGVAIALLAALAVAAVNGVVRLRLVRMFTFEGARYVFMSRSNGKEALQAVFKSIEFRPRRGS